jgi:ribosomal protein S18 acetylase RimI-like enzyme
MPSTLEIATDRDIEQLRGWFPDADSVNLWGGPKFRYPFTQETFAEDCGLHRMRSFSLKRPTGRMVSFGQYYYRYDRGHLARLITNPEARRLGHGSRLIAMLINAIAEEGEAAEVSLFVYRHNRAAYECYRSLGFTVQEYPDDAPLKELCYYLARPIDLEMKKP